MELDRETVTQLAVSGTAVVVFVAVAAFVSQRYAVPGSGSDATPPALQPTGGLAMIGVIALFVLLMAAAGLYVYRADLDE